MCFFQLSDYLPKAFPLSDLPPRYPHRHASLDVNGQGIWDTLRDFAGHRGAKVAKMSTSSTVHPSMRQQGTNSNVFVPEIGRAAGSST